MNDTPQTLVAQALVTTPVPARYLGQLCKHFQHRREVVLEEGRGSIRFDAGLCELDVPDETTLRMKVTATSEDGLATLEDVVVRHLVRFAFRETLDITWHQAR